MKEYSGNDVKLAIIGGTGLYNLNELEIIATSNPETPWGYPSSPITICQTKDGFKVAFLARHGHGHTFNPSEVPVRANIAALKLLGVEAILAFSAVGSLRQEVHPRDFVLPDQIIDRTKGRPSTFFENGLVAHCSFAHPFDDKLAAIVANHAHALKGNSLSSNDSPVKLHTKGTLIVMEGPAFSTCAESHMYRSWGADIINMSALPEAKLARELEIVYQMVCMSTDYDCWHEEEAHVTVEQVMGNLKSNSENAKLLILSCLPDLQSAILNGDLKHLQGTMKFACVTAKERRNPETVAKLNKLLPGYY